MAQLTPWVSRRNIERQGGTALVLDRPVTLELETTVSLTLTPSENGGFVASNDDLQVAVVGATQDEAIDSFIDGVRTLAWLCVERGLPLPPSLHSR